jgi:hypothetical protein
MSQIANQIDAARRLGFSTISDVLPPTEISNLVDLVEAFPDTVSTGKRGGIRNIFGVFPWASKLAWSPPLRRISDQVLGKPSVPVRGTLFDKTPGANWKVPWHQDLTIEVVERVEVAGFGPWSTKAGAVSIQPPAWVLEEMISIRLHLDPCGEENGALRVVPRSHLLGKLPEEDAVRRGAQGPEVICEANAGDAVLMKPLLLHASSASRSPAHRRVIHIDYAACELPAGMMWHSATEF